jgi:hypothetical protein
MADKYAYLVGTILDKNNLINVDSTPIINRPKVSSQKGDQMSL